MSREWINSRHGYRLSKSNGGGTLILCPIHNRWHPQTLRGRHGPTGKAVPNTCPDCKQDEITLGLSGYALGIPYRERLRPENLARIEEHCGKKLLRYHKRG
ncbi:hypothetical protein ABZR86_02500 [Dyella marensis]|uniref:Uncharacterized protein n=1 Tax=Dyella marensis TaxID=500610 RepID=A0A1I1ZZG5_9GAMM|nr:MULTISPECIES: hypothetical protein [Dyella]SFE37234.1 hypothetical protein SAMN02799615_00874 [Dyella marensis]